MSSRTRRPRPPAPAALRKPFPWGTVLGAGLLGLALVGMLGYAVVNAGSAAPNPLRDADRAVEGISVAAEPPSQAHESGPLTYDTTPSSGGAHNGAWTTCTGAVYPEQVPDENATHSLEHGAVWISYTPDLPEDDVQALTELVEGTDYRLLSPYPEQDTPISLQAWGRQLQVDSADDPRIETFLNEYTNGPQTPEKGATCSGGTQATGADPAEAPA